MAENMDAERGEDTAARQAATPAESPDAVTTEDKRAETAGEAPTQEGALPPSPDEPGDAPAVAEAAAETAAVEAAAAETAAEAGEESARPELPAEEMSFAEMFELAEKQHAEKRKKEKATSGLRTGQVIFARVVSVAGDSVFLDVGKKTEGIIPKAELVGDDGEVEINEGDKVEVRVRKFEAGAVILTKVLPHQSLKNREELREAHRLGLPVEGRVTGQNKGGYDVEIAGMRAFCPASQIDVRPGKPEDYVLTKFAFKIVEFKDNGRNLVVSRRQLVDEENKKKAQELLETLEVGKVVKGKVTTLKDYGAFVDLGGLEGLIHATEMSYGHVKKPSDMLKVGDEVEVEVLRIEDAPSKRKGQVNKKISLSMKALQQDPWATAKNEFKEGQKVTGKVARIQDFGAFVELLPGVDGLVHVSNMTLGRRVTNPRDVVKEGDTVEATITKIEWKKKRIGLSMVKTPQELANELRKGNVFEGTVDRIEDFGIFVALPSGARGLVPAAETGTQRGTDLNKEFQAGAKVKVLVQEVDKRSGKIRLSIRSAKEAEERAEFEGYMQAANQESKKGLGTLGDLLRDRFGAKLGGLSKE